MAYGYNTPNVDASLRYLLVKSSCEVESVEDNVQKTSFSCSSVGLGIGIKPKVSGIRKTRNPKCLDPPIPCGLAESLRIYELFMKIRG